MGGTFTPLEGTFTPLEGTFTPLEGTFTPLGGTFTPLEGTFTPTNNILQLLAFWCITKGIYRFSRYLQCTHYRLSTALFLSLTIKGA